MVDTNQPGLKNRKDLHELTRSKTRKWLIQINPGLKQENGCNKSTGFKT